MRPTSHCAPSLAGSCRPCPTTGSARTPSTRPHHSRRKPSSSGSRSGSAAASATALCIAALRVRPRAPRGPRSIRRAFSPDYEDVELTRAADLPIQLRTGKSKKPGKISRRVEPRVPSLIPNQCAKSAEVVCPEYHLKTAAYKFRTKTAKCGALEKNCRREQNSGLCESAAVPEVCGRRAVFIGDFCALASRQRVFGVD